MTQIESFFQHARNDPRIATGHISIYVTLCLLWDQQQPADHLCFVSSDVKPLCKVRGKSNFHRLLHDLDCFGYIKYVPSYDRYHGSQVKLTDLNQFRMRKARSTFATRNRQLQLI